MRLRRLLVVLLATLALAGCANPRARMDARGGAMDARAQASFSELDYRAYGAPVRTSAYVAVRSSVPWYS